MKSTEQIASMAELRAEIDRIDLGLIELLAKRAEMIDRAIEIKAAAGLPARISERVEEVVELVRVHADSKGFDPEFAETIWRQLIEWSISREERVLGESDKRVK